MARITNIRAEEIRDSRDNPTLQVFVAVADVEKSFAVPSGASTGSAEAHELRDENGGMSLAIERITKEIAPALMGSDASNQRDIDERLLRLDGTAQKTHLGGNAMVGVSVACAKVAAASSGVQVFEHLRTLADIKPSRAVPFLYMNYINGGKHAKSPLAFQEHMLVPHTESVRESLAVVAAVEKEIPNVLTEKYGASVAGTMGDEGGYVIPETEPEVPFALLTDAIQRAGYDGRVHLATDVAASSFYHNGRYSIGGRNYSAQELDAVYAQLTATYGLISIEDPFAEDAMSDFARLQTTLPAVRIVGDDLTVTSSARIARAGVSGAIRAVIIKPNQIGTLSETLDAMQAARARDIDCIVSHRSGETMDDFIADLAFAFGVFGIKAGALRKAERRVKYERLEAISS